jgi:hypothetical protein
VLHSEKRCLKEENKLLLGIPEQPGIPFDFSDPKPLPETIKADCKEEEIPIEEQTTSHTITIDQTTSDKLFNISGGASSVEIGVMEYDEYDDSTYTGSKIYLSGTYAKLKYPTP